jgi:hypothetical protein
MLSIQGFPTYKFKIASNTRRDLNNVDTHVKFYGKFTLI